MTLHQHRILLIVPVAKVAAVVAWIRAQVDATCPDLLGPPLNPSGLEADPVTHRWQSASWVDSDCRQLLGKMCDLAAVAKPSQATWNGWTNAEKRAWFAGVRDTVYANYGVYATLSDNTGTWDAPQAALDATGLKVIAVVGGA